MLLCPGHPHGALGLLNGGQGLGCGVLLPRHEGLTLRYLAQVLILGLRGCGMFFTIAHIILQTCLSVLLLMPLDLH